MDNKAYVAPERTCALPLFAVQLWLWDARARVVVGRVGLTA